MIARLELRYLREQNQPSSWSTTLLISAIAIHVTAVNKTKWNNEWYCFKYTLWHPGGSKVVSYIVYRRTFDLSLSGHHLVTS